MKMRILYRLPLLPKKKLLVCCYVWCAGGGRSLMQHVDTQEKGNVNLNSKPLNNNSVSHNNISDILHKDPPNISRTENPVVPNKNPILSGTYTWLWAQITNSDTSVLEAKLIQYERALNRIKTRAEEVWTNISDDNSAKAGDIALNIGMFGPAPLN